MPTRLHIGGQVKAEGWEVVNALEADYVDHQCNANDLSRFDTESVTEIYASHILEHFDYNGEIQHTLKEWNRVLCDGGRMYISVPDMDILASLFLAKDKLSLQDRFWVMRMLFGGHMDEYDYHVAGLNQEILTKFLLDAGFCNIQRVRSFGMFKDTSETCFKGVPISLNLIAEKNKAAIPMTPPPKQSIGRNDPCPCGSGRKFKKCHGLAVDKQASGK